jgi:hypothetical protein
MVSSCRPLPFYRKPCAPERMAALFKRGSRAMRSAAFLLVVTKTCSSSSSLGACDGSPFQYPKSRKAGGEMHADLSS